MYICLFCVDLHHHTRDGTMTQRITECPRILDHVFPHHDVCFSYHCYSTQEVGAREMCICMPEHRNQSIFGRKNVPWRKHSTCPDMEKSCRHILRTTAEWMRTWHAWYCTRMAASWFERENGYLMASLRSAELFGTMLATYIQLLLSCWKKIPTPACVSPVALSVTCWEHACGASLFYCDCALFFGARFRWWCVHAVAMWREYEAYCMPDAGRHAHGIVHVVYHAVCGHDGRRTSSLSSKGAPMVVSRATWPCWLMTVSPANCFACLSAVWGPGDAAGFLVYRKEK